MSRRLCAAALAVASVGCTTGDTPILLCHNANCAEGTPADADDTVAALTASLALRMPDGTPVTDGIELDSTWDRARGACTFGHSPLPDNAPFADAAAQVVAYLAAAAPGTAPHRTAAYYFKIELKMDVGGGALHTTDEVAAHVACVTSAARAAIAAGAASHNPVVPIFDSDDPALLAAIDPHSFPGADPLFETNWGTPLPAGFAPQIYTLGWYDLPQALVWVDGGFLIWARDPSLADLDKIIAHGPGYVDVNNVLDARGLIDAR